MRRLPGAGASGAGLFLVLAAATLLPWAVGGTPMWAVRPAGFLLVAALASEIWRRGAVRAVGGREAAWLWPAAALAALALAQAIPLPLAAVRAVSPPVARAWESTVAAPSGPSGREAVARLEAAALSRVPEAEAVPAPRPGAFAFSPPPAGAPVHATLSYHPAGTRERLVWFVALLCAFVVVRRAASRPGGRRAARTAVLANAGLLAAAALVFRVAAPGRLLGVVEPLRGGNPYGPYVNPTHFAFAMELVVPWLVALAWVGVRESRRWSSPAAWVPAAGALLCAAAAFGSGSKAAAILIPLSLGLFGLTASGGAAGRGRILAIAAASLAGLAVATALTPARARLLDFVASGGLDLRQSDRVLLWRHALDLVAAHPVVGSGFGAFRHVVPSVLPAGEAQAWHQLHNDYLEVLVGGGIAAAILVVLLAWGYGRRALAAVRGSSGVPLERLGMLAGLLTVGVHALFDFGHQMPANALLFVVVAALAVPVREASGDGPPRRSLVGGAVALAMVVAAAFDAARGIPAGIALSEGTREAAAGTYGPAATALDAAAVGANRFEALWSGGDVRLGLWDRMGAEDASGAPGARMLEEACRRFLAADREVAGSGWPLQGLGSAYRRAERADAAGRPFDLSWIGESSWAAIGRTGRIAIGLHRLAVEREPMVSAHWDALIASLLDLGLREEAARSLQEAARLQPILVQHQGLDTAALDDEMVAAFHQGSAEALGAVPMAQTQRHLLALGQTAYRLRRYDEAESWLRRALQAPADRISRAEVRFWLATTAVAAGRTGDAATWFETTVDVPNFREASLAGLARLAAERGDLEEAAARWDVLRREHPHEPSYVLAFARAETGAGRPRRAVEVLRAAAVRRPGDLEVGLGLVEALRAAGDAATASREIRRLESRFSDDPRVRELAAAP